MNSNRWKWIYNPFEFVAGWKAFGIGVVVLALTTLVGYWGNTVFYALEVKLTQGVTLGAAFRLQAMGLAVTVVVMYLAALIVARHTRFQDILGCVTLAKYPLLLVAVGFLLFGGPLASVDAMQIVSNELPASGYVTLAAMAVFSLVMLVWEVTLLYNAFRVSTNLKGAKCAVTFTLVTLLTEIAAVALAGAVC